MHASQRPYAYSCMHGGWRLDAERHILRVKVHLYPDGRLYLGGGQLEDISRKYGPPWSAQSWEGGLRIFDSAPVCADSRTNLGRDYRYIEIIDI